MKPQDSLSRSFEVVLSLKGRKIETFRPTLTRDCRSEAIRRGRRGVFLHTIENKQNRHEAATALKEIDALQKIAEREITNVSERANYFFVPICRLRLLCCVRFYFLAQIGQSRTVGAKGFGGRILRPHEESEKTRCSIKDSPLLSLFIVRGS